MCIIIAKDKNIALPDRDSLYNSYLHNKDGIGVAVLKSDYQKVMIKKDFKNFDLFYNWITENITTEDIAILHFRIATSGKVDLGNAHPFPITNNKKLLRKTLLYSNFAVAHNGVIAQYSYTKSKYSDTQKFIIDILANIKYKLDNHAIIKLVESYIIGDKLAIIDSKQRKLILIGNYIEKNGLFYSNSSYREHKPVIVETINPYKNNPNNTIDKRDYLQYCDICNRNKKAYYMEYYSCYICKDCRKQNLEFCDVCFDILPKKDLLPFENGYLCQMCFNDIAKEHKKQKYKHKIHDNKSYYDYPTP